MSKTDEKNQEVALVGAGAQVPAYLKEQMGQGAVLNGVDASDLILPRIKLLQAISTECEAFDAAKPGLFWHNVLGEAIGPEFDFVVCSFRKKYLLMAPMGDSRKVMARAEDGIHWTPADAEFRVKLKGVKEEQVWRTAETVAASGLHKFGSSVRGDENSKPAAVLVYEYLVYLPEFPQFSPIIMSLARSQAKKGKDLNSKITFRGAPLQAMRFKARVCEETGDEGPFKNYDFISNGWASEQEFERCKLIAEQFGDYKVADEEALATEGDAHGTSNSAPKSKEY